MAIKYWILIFTLEKLFVGPLALAAGNKQKCDNFHFLWAKEMFTIAKVYLFPP